jgi:23S rRNA pseudouridine2605 synthase
VRLAKYLASRGVASRRAAERMIEAGRVSIDGVPVTDPARGVSIGDQVQVDGSPVPGAQTPVVYAVNKPVGVVSTARDPQGRPTVVELVDSPTRLYPVGRLDMDTTGLILVTNDGNLAHRLTHPRFEVPKTYRATVARGPVRAATLRALRRGVELEEGITAPASVRLLAPDRLELTIHEGRKHQVKRMCEAMGHPVTRLERVAIGDLELGDLRPGVHRRLGREEVASLLDASHPGEPTLSAGAADRRT